MAERPLPFEPNRKRPKAAKSTPGRPASSMAPAQQRPATAIPEVVSQRMIRRMAAFCGLPTLLGLLTFPASYGLIRHGLELPVVATVAVTMGFFGLGVVGLSYGLLSASWDTERQGGRWGWAEFRLNWGRLRESWRQRES